MSREERTRVIIAPEPAMQKKIGWDGLRKCMDSYRNFKEAGGSIYGGANKSACERPEMAQEASIAMLPGKPVSAVKEQLEWRHRGINGIVGAEVW